jgi:Flp pilus assembly protein TadD
MAFSLMAHALPQQEINRRLAGLEARLRQGGVEAATDLAERELAGGLEHPLPLNLLAYRHEQAGRYDEAQALLKRALRLAPKDVFILNSLGLLLARQDRRAEALETFDRALALDPKFPQAHHAKAQSLEAIGEEDAAIGHYIRAAQLNGRYAEPLASLALLAAGRGDLDYASGCVARARAIEPGQPLAGMAQATIDLARKDFPAVEAGLTALLAGPLLDAADRPAAWAMLGDALDGQDRVNEAFDAYGRGKAEAAQAHAGRFAGDAEGELSYVRRLIRDFPEAMPARGNPDTDDAGPRQHIFLVGFPRSGTTLLEQVLISHPDVVTLDERDALMDAERDLLRPVGGLERLMAAPDTVLDDYRRGYWRWVAALGREVAGKVFVDKLPLNTVRLPLIARLFPKARIIFALRDPRDVVLSCFRRSFRVNAAMYEFTSLDGAARFYDAVMAFAALCRERLPLDVAEARYEDLVADFDAETQRLCAFVGLEWDPAMRDFAEAAKRRVIRTPSAAQVRRGLYATGREQWRRYADELRPVEGMLAPWVARFGYPASEA